PTCHATKASDVAINVATMPASPFMPSTIFSACVHPPTAIMLKIRDTGQNDSNQLAQLIPTRVRPPSNHQAMAADRNAASKPLLAPNSFVTSYITPAIKTGSAEINNTGHNQVSVKLRGPTTSSPASVPATTANPPTRGAARPCMACGLSMSVSPVKLLCHLSDATIRPPTMKATMPMVSQLNDATTSGTRQAP